MRILRNTLWTTVGLFGLAALIAMPTAADQVILDDLIVDGSICAGFDCVNGESFGFDTIRIKENNLRIRAMDTSTSASFPTNDWQITFNDSSNGGAEKFSIDDITGGRTPFTIEASAPSHSLYVDDGGRLGLGTSTPVADVHIKTGNTPTLRLEQDGSSGFAAQTWDVAGNEANFFIRDASNGSTLPLRIFPAAPSNALTIEASTGDIGIGTTSPDSVLHLVSNDVTGVAMENTNAGVRWDFRTANNGNFNFNQDTVGLAMQIQDVSLDVAISNDLAVAGTVTKGGGAFRIDHPLDPANKYLQHSFVESPDMLNVYNGNVELNGEGHATVKLPVWFENLNRDYRYQLTPVGGPAPNLHLSQQVEAGFFQIAGGQPGQVVSWQVTGVRQDAFAEANRIQVEGWKSLEARGTYLFPEGFEGKETASEDHLATKD